MKRILTSILALVTVASFAQSPEKMSYQAVIRNSTDALVKNQSVGMQISILQGSSTGTAVYVETQTETTNTNGLVSIEIGGGTVMSGDFTAIDWSTGLYFIKTETDPLGGTTYTITGTSQLLSVPYALFSKTALFVINDSVNDIDSDTTNEIQNLASVLSTNNDGGSLQIKNIANATEPQDAITKAQIDTLITTTGLICKLINIYTVQEILEMGNRSALEMFEARLNDSSTTSCISLAEIIDAGGDLNDIINSGVTIPDLYNNYGLRVVDLLKGGVSLAQMFYGGLPLQTVQEDSTITAYIAAGATADNIFTFEVKYITNNSESGDIERYYALNFLISNGYTATQLLTKVTESDLIRFTDMPINDIYTINSGNIPGILSTGVTGGSLDEPYISISDLLNGGVPETTITAASLTAQQQQDLALQIRLNNGETPYQIYLTDTTLYNQIMGKIYEGGYIIYLDTIGFPAPLGSGIVKGHSFYAPYPAGTPDYGTDSHNKGKSAWEDAEGRYVSFTQDLYNYALNTNKELNCAKFSIDYAKNGHNDWTLPHLRDIAAYNTNYFGNTNINNLANSSNYNDMMHFVKMGTGPRFAGGRGSMRDPDTVATNAGSLDNIQKSGSNHPFFPVRQFNP